MPWQLSVNVSILGTADPFVAAETFLTKEEAKSFANQIMETGDGELKSRYSGYVFEGSICHGSRNINDITISEV